MNTRLFTIVTICLNEERNIVGTLESILSQKFTNFEYIIKDGGSKDKTNQIIKRYQNKFKKKGILFKHIVKEDSGIYDAMNQTTKICKGIWINFMNAGDKFYNEEVLFDLSLQISVNQKNVGVLYGNTLFQISKKYAMIMNHNIEFLRTGWSICHQSSFINIDVIKKFPFDSNYVICGDYDQFLRIQESGIQFKNLNIIIAEVNRSGISNTNLKVLFEENRILNKKYNLGKKKETSIYLAIIKRIIVKIFPPIERICFVKNQMKRINKYR